MAIVIRTVNAREALTLRHDTDRNTIEVVLNETVGPTQFYPLRTVHLDALAAGNLIDALLHVRELLSGPVVFAHSHRQPLSGCVDILIESDQAPAIEVTLEVCRAVDLQDALFSIIADIVERHRAAPVRIVWSNLN